MTELELSSSQFDANINSAEVLVIGLDSNMTENVVVDVFKVHGKFTLIRLFSKLVLI